ncbi:uncharacterized protein UV8b_05550 [Ustilaginoidea virens]|uniref:GATA-type domain-containing protein n=1 Tax=Ustilaginoidea virens TaxID=1159556 RepID=A0A8E5MJ65_USTVR|nr:uncharacterized protein UV8b_05550 [Ustilaginoidea virens]QUC21307.1 hypothetical protein UV8b_05550 [Ustilaginoidea virens]
MSVAASENEGGGQALLHPGSRLLGQEVAHHGCSKSAGVRLSLNALRLGESFDTIKLDVGLLAWHVGHFPAENDTSGDKVCEDDLYAILELSQNIGTNVSKIFALRNQHVVATEFDSIPEGAGSPPESFRNTRKTPEAKRRKSYEIRHGPRFPAAKRMRSVSCRTCLTDHTPKWRNGPAGPGTLCNVCGLIYAKRRGRVRERVVKQPSSC